MVEIAGGARIGSDGRTLVLELERRFFEDEVNEYVRALLLAEIGRRDRGRAEFTFNTVDVLIDVDAGTVKLADILAAGPEVVLPLDDFSARLQAG
ncbi:hypothetical protein E1218_28580 [Kribbella turkmenica]|uniref:Uncharacterized protein n=1 Tax=Kribbella turkmenica TaxID=2530375 RepID=A0A4V2YDX2_9ACTN|nr:hypothetical protein [Kribbella turkmenica]TDD17096.1 hypothetical protein E1218_28580 [Kribbella turkmenica]